MGEMTGAEVREIGRGQWERLVSTSLESEGRHRGL